jgi:hypothetical protein
MKREEDEMSVSFGVHEEDEEEEEAEAEEEAAGSGGVKRGWSSERRWDGMITIATSRACKINFKR